MRTTEGTDAFVSGNPATSRFGLGGPPSKFVQYVFEAGGGGGDEVLLELQLVKNKIVARDRTRLVQTWPLPPKEALVFNSMRGQSRFSTRIRLRGAMVTNLLQIVAWLFIVQGVYVLILPVPQDASHYPAATAIIDGQAYLWAGINIVTGIGLLFSQIGRGG